MYKQLSKQESRNKQVEGTDLAKKIMKKFLEKEIPNFNNSNKIEEK